MQATEDDILTADDATLLLYVAGELDDAGRRTLESRLEGDTHLRGRLATMTRLDQAMRVDADARPISAADSRQALGASLRLVREQALLLQSRPAMRPAGRRLAGVPRWMWGTAVAATVAVGMLVWISNSDPSPMRPDRRLAAEDTNRSIVGSEVRAFSAAFLPIEAESSEGEPSDINSELDALNMLAIMSDPIDMDASEN